MKYSLYLELSYCFGDKLGLSADECQKLQDAAGVTPFGKTNLPLVTKTTKNGGVLEISQKTSSNTNILRICLCQGDFSSWNGAEIKIVGDSDSLFGTVVDDVGGVYFYTKQKDEPLKVGYYDKTAIDALKSMGVTDGAREMYFAFKSHGIIPDLEGELKIGSCVEALTYIITDPIKRCSDIVSSEKQKEKIIQ